MSEVLTLDEARTLTATQRWRLRKRGAVVPFVPRAINFSGMAKTEWGELVRRGRISLSWESPKRKAAQSLLLRSLMRDPEVHDRWLAAVKAANEKRADAIKALGGRFHRNHPCPLLPPLGPKERRRYRYLRTMADRATSLEAIMIERGTRP